MYSLPIALRAYTEVTSERDSKTKKQRSNKNARTSFTDVLVFDTETTVDADQQLTFGSYRQFEIMNGEEMICNQEGIFYDDNLPQKDPKGFAKLKEYVQTKEADIQAGGIKHLFFYSRSDFVKKVFFKAAYKTRAAVVAFNLPFDLSRLATKCGEARAFYKGGFSLAFCEYKDKSGQVQENPYYPRILIKNIDSKRSLVRFTKPFDPSPNSLIPEGSKDGQPDSAYVFGGYFLDLRTLAFSSAGDSHSLDSACKAFGVKQGKQHTDGHGVITEQYIDYNRQDVKATAELYSKLMEEFKRHQISTSPTQVYSPATIGKAYLKEMGIKPVLKRQPDFPKEVLGYAMAAYFGGRSECRIRRHAVPVIYVDFLSMYPTVNVLMRIWDHLTAERIETVEATDEIRAFVDNVALEDCLDPKIWRKLTALVQVEANGEIFPTRARYDRSRPSWQIGVNPLKSKAPMWYTLADALAAKLLSGKTPKILRAIKMVPRGKQKGLRAVKLRGVVDIDPVTNDLYKTAVEQRRRVKSQKDIDQTEKDRIGKFLKVLVNSSSYGIFAEINKQATRSRKRQEVKVYGFEGNPFSVQVSAPEEPGVFSFPPIAACVTAAARLMLALLERLVTDVGGTYAFCDTDSMAIVATKDGGTIACPGGALKASDGKDGIRALSHNQVNQIINKFERLNPYDKEAVPGSIIKIEKESFDPKTKELRQLFCYSISTKRYALFNLDDTGQHVLRKWSEHGLGHLLNPTNPDSKDRDWIREFWEYIVTTDGLGMQTAEPAWLDRPAISQITISSPELLKPFKKYNKERPYEGQVKPFSFLLAAHVALLGHPPGVDPLHFHLVAPYNPDPRQWLKIKWVDIYSGKTFKITGSSESTPDLARIKTYRDVLNEYRVHIEAKSLGPDGQTCKRFTSGLLLRRPVLAVLITYIGKESNKLEQVQNGIIHSIDLAIDEYEDPALFKKFIVPVLREIPLKNLQKKSGLDRRTLQRIRVLKATPSSQNRQKLLGIVEHWLRRDLM